MAYWVLKEYTKAATTLVEEASQASLEVKTDFTESSLSDIFNFYSYLRKHPLVVRQRLNEAQIQIGGTEKFLALAKELENQVTPSERRLYFRTASMHMAFGCPLLALDVLSKLPSNLSIVMPGESLSTLNQELGGSLEIGVIQFCWLIKSKFRAQDRQLKKRRWMWIGQRHRMLWTIMI